jgi:hypothetical protein
MKKVLILSNSSGGFYNSREERLESLIEQGKELYKSVPYGRNGELCVKKDV